MKTVSWFSAGVSSAVATWLMRDQIDHIIYVHIDDQHSDTMRFVRDCEQWFGKEIEILQSHYGSVDTACRQISFVNGPGGAACTRVLKKRVRKDWEKKNPGPYRYVWGMECTESARAERLRDTMPTDEHLFPLIDNVLSKEDAHGLLRDHSIRRPKMYDMGYNNNNCVGCVKGGMGYWNKIREDFPEVFQKRAEMERIIGHSCVRGVFLDELDPERGRHTGPVVAECGIFCEIANTEVKA